MIVRVIGFFVGDMCGFVLNYLHLNLLIQTKTLNCFVGVLR